MGGLFHIHKGSVGDKTISSKRGRGTSTAAGLTVEQSERLTDFSSGCLLFLALPAGLHAASGGRIGVGEGHGKKVLVVDDGTCHCCELIELCCVVVLYSIERNGQKENETVQR